MTNFVCYWDPDERCQKERPMTAEEEAQRLLDIAASKRAKVPEEVAMWQARAELIERGLLTDVHTVFESISDPIARDKAKAKFEYATVLRRQDPLLLGLQPALQWSDEFLDTLFIHAEKQT